MYKITAFFEKYMYMFKKVAKEDSKKLIGFGMVKDFWDPEYKCNIKVKNSICKVCF